MEMRRILNLISLYFATYLYVSWQAYGQTTYLITTLELVPRGTEGAVSLEGTLAGVAAAAAFAGIALAVGQVRRRV
jgi:uncharacterized membrane protein